MLFDFIIIIILALFATFGYRSGFALSIAKLGGWILAFVLAFILDNKIGEWLKTNTDMFTDLNTHVYDVCTSFVEKYTAGVIAALPEGAGDPIEVVGTDLITSISGKIATAAFTVFVFSGIVIFVVVIIFVLTFLLSKKYRDGIVGGIDGFAGLLFGLCQGVLATLVILALLMPIAHIISPEVFGFVKVTMEKSFVAGIIYENNPLLMLISNVFPSDLDPTSWIDTGVASEGFVMKDWESLL